MLEEGGGKLNHFLSSFVGLGLCLGFLPIFPGVLRKLESRILENAVTIKVNETNEVWPNLWFTEMVKTRIDVKP